MHLDIQTVSILYLFTLLLSTMQLFFAWRINRDSAVLSKVCLAFVAACFGFPLIGLREFVPDFLSYSLSNSMLLLYQLFMIDAIRANNDQPGLRFKTFIAFFAIHTPLLNYFVYIDPSHAGRSIANYLFHLPMIAYCVYGFLSHYSRRGLAERVLGLTFLLNFVINAAVLPVDLSRGSGYDGVINSTRTDLITFGYLVVTLMLTYGFINLANSRLIQKLALIADFDDLTGCLNRRAFYQKVERILSRSEQEPFACLMFDLDHFKAVNDTYGHYAGDTVLKSFGMLLRQSVRPMDVVGRLGGEEFGVFLPGVSREQITTITDRIQAEVKALSFDAENMGKISVTCSVGVFLHMPEEQKKAASYYFTQADNALYAAKRKGRDCVVDWSSLTD